MKVRVRANTTLGKNISAAVRNRTVLVVQDKHGQVSIVTPYSARFDEVSNEWRINAVLSLAQARGG